VLVCIECNPKFGPAAFDAIAKLAAGEVLPTKLVNTDRVFTKETAAAYMPEAY
jgi:galactofuranose transport system substrate-binding protein